MFALTDRPAYIALDAHAERLRALHLRDLFTRDPLRFERFSVRLEGLLFDFSKHRIVPESIKLLTDLARECEVERMREAMFAGELINRTENRAVLHMALRDRSALCHLRGRSVAEVVEAERAKMGRFVEAVHAGTFCGHTGRPITDVVNIGIGGSDLGPAMMTRALWPDHRPGLRAHFVSNIDGADLTTTLAGLDPRTTLFVVASKTFTTQETLTNARSARAWFLASGAPSKAIAKHFVAVSTNAEAVAAFGIDPAQMFGFWDWVGGRFSVWSSIGLSLALAVGMPAFERLLDGAHAADRHFVEAPLERNVPVLMALLGVWYTHFFGATAHAVLPYDHGLARLPAYLQQAEMESNGKRVRRNGLPVRWPTCPVLFGEPGTNGQHAFYQLLHQGTAFIPCDFIVAARPRHDLAEHHRLLLANCFAQSEALMRGRTEAEARAELTAAGMATEAIDRLAPHKVFPGGRPSTTFLLDQLDAFALGQLVALYEHKIFVQGVIWDVFSFDQWGVELGKALAGQLGPLIDSAEPVSGRDASTTGLIAATRALRKKS
ncbi:MAG: glucose-6-phosphate isomerase [Myxococcales bacterium]|nr:glucose-6-phosphate isomerase [Myxococcales bacterium]